MPNILILIFIIAISIVIGFYISGLIKKERTPYDELSPAPTQKTTSEEINFREKQLMLDQAISIIQKLSESIPFSTDLKELTDEIVKITSKILNANICALLLLDKSTDMLSVFSSIGIDENFARQIHIKNGEEISGLAAKFNETKIINNFEKDIKLYRLKFDICYKNSLVSFPISFKNTALGVLNISGKNDNAPFSSTEIAIIKIISLETAIALQNFRLFKKLQKGYLDTIIALANAIDAKDPYTYRHSTNVTKYAVRIAREIRLTSHIIDNIRYAGLLHDIGKIGIKDSILSKPAKLSEEEYAIIQTHSAKGEEIIKSLPFLEEVAKIVRHHHERFDGKGYPDRIKGENIKVEARIMGISDSFDAMITKRPYRDPLSLEQAKEELIKNKGGQFDPYIVDTFLKILEKEPHLVLKC